MAFGCAWCTLSPVARAVVPPPDGGYPGFNTAEGQKTLFSLTTGQGNTGVGWFTLESLTTGNFNTAIGVAALLLNTGNQNTATGAGALLSNTTGGQNTANGFQALLSNTTGVDNTATGFQALFSNTTGSDNTAHGAFALSSDTTGIANTAMGYFALYSNTTGNSNTAVGFNVLRFSTAEGNTAFGAQALTNNTTGDENTANGDTALHSNATGSNNTATGGNALSNNTTGGANTANGFQALLNNANGGNNTAIGGGALFHNTTGSVNVAVGDFAGGNLTTGDANIDILNPGVAAESNTIRIGVTQTRTFIAGIFGTNVSGSTVVVNSAGQLGVAASSRRFKREIKPMERASEAILALRPVTFRYKQEFDPEGIAQFGLVAEEVEKVNSDLVARDETGKVYTVRYEAVNAMLLNEFLKEHRKVQDLEKGMAAITAQLKEQAAQIQKVSAHLEMSKPAASVVLNNP
jgi:trimeric autotransporter adhesin